MIQLDNIQPIEIKYATKYIIVSYDCLAPADALYELFQTSVHSTYMLPFLWSVAFSMKTYSLRVSAHLVVTLWGVSINSRWNFNAVFLFANINNTRTMKSRFITVKLYIEFLSDKSHPRIFFYFYSNETSDPILFYYIICIYLWNKEYQIVCLGISKVSRNKSFYHLIY